MRSILGGGAIVLLFISAIYYPSWAGFYKYQDENGVWHFTDTSPEIQEGAAQEIFKDTQSPTQTTSSNYGQNLQKQLSEAVPPKNKIEKARNATVMIKTALATGSGFFISSDGLIVTNKHVVHGGEVRHQKTEVALESRRKELNKLKEHLENELNWLETEEEWLSKAYAELEKRQDRLMNHVQFSSYNAYLAEYKTRFGLYADRKKNYDKLALKYNQAENEYKKYRQEFEDRDFELTYQRGCAIILADKTELNANEVAASEKHDLVLLRLEGYQTPFIKPGNAKRLAQGDILYAIGNPMNMNHSVTSGIFSGFREDFIQTNAQVSPGNSGGPLVTADGEVVGVNTKKIVDEYAEGLGFAIPIDIVMGEFNNYIQLK
jgi:S1-C subfamily serine protease